MGLIIIERIKTYMHKGNKIRFQNKVIAVATWYLQSSQCTGLLQFTHKHHSHVKLEVSKVGNQNITQPICVNNNVGLYKACNEYSSTGECD